MKACHGKLFLNGFIRMLSIADFEICYLRVKSCMYYHKRTVYCSLIVDADEMKSKALSNAQRAIQDQEARVCWHASNVVLIYPVVLGQGVFFFLLKYNVKCF